MSRSIFLEAWEYHILMQGLSSLIYDSKETIRVLGLTGWSDSPALMAIQETKIERAKLISKKLRKLFRAKR